MFTRLFFIFLFLAPSLFAQGSTTYDVSVIHHPKPDAEGSGMDVDDAVIQASNANLKRLLEYAYDVRPDLITGIPPALESQRYDLIAKVLDPDMKALDAMPKDKRRAMLIPVLKDRFALKAHIETKDLPLYELTVVNPAKLTPLPAGGDNHGVHQTRNKLEATDITMERFCSTLTNILHKPVIDKTGTTAGYTLTLKWAPDDNTDPNNQDPPLITALQEQLGLKLKSSRGPVPTLVVDHVEAPTEN